MQLSRLSTEKMTSCCEQAFYVNTLILILLIGAPETMQWGEHVGVHSRGQSPEGWLVNLFYTSTCTNNLNGEVCRLMVRMILT